MDEILKELSEVQNPLIRQDFIKKLALVDRIEENEVLQKLKVQMRKGNYEYSENKSKTKEISYSSTHEKAELGIIKVLVSNDEDARKLVIENLKVNQIKNPKLNKLIEILLKTKETNPVEIISSFNSSEEREIISKTLMDEDDTSSIVQMAKDCLKTLKKVSIKEKIKQIRIKIREMESKNQDTLDLMKEIIELQKELHA